MIQFVCQVCDYVAQVADNPDGEEWYVDLYEGQYGRIKILTCPKCKDLTPEQVLLGFEKRIREGRDSRYH